MIRALRLGNFKAFAETQEAPIRPLTLVYGPNSAGKSSLIHGLALAHHAIRTGDLDTQRTELGGESIDLGGFWQYVHRRDATRVVEWAVDLETSHFRGRLAELLAPARVVTIQVLLGWSEGAGVAVQAIAISADGMPLVRMSARGGGKLRIDRLDQEHPVLRAVIQAIVLATTTTVEVRAADYEGLDAAIDGLIPDISVRLERFLPRVDSAVSREQETAQALLFPVSQGERSEGLEKAVRLFLPRALRDLIDGLSGAVEEEIARLRYLGPLRSYPPRHLAFSPHHDPNWLAGGGHAWDVVRRDAGVRDQVNKWLMAPERLKTPYEILVRQLIAVDQIDEPLRQAIEGLQAQGLVLNFNQDTEDAGQGYGAVEAWVRDPEGEVDRFRMTILQSNPDRHDELVLIDRRSNTYVSHRDVGIGVSQVLPVLVHAYGSKAHIVAIEQPEIHLHPALQAELGDVFIESALGDRRNTFLLETHSEHLLLRIMRRMRETHGKKLPPGMPEVRPEDVMVLYVEPDGPRSIVRQMPLDERGELVKAWPGGFFEEGLREVF